MTILGVVMRRPMGEVSGRHERGQLRIHTVTQVYRKELRELADAGLCAVMWKPLAYAMENVHTVPGAPGIGAPIKVIARG